MAARFWINGGVDNNWSSISNWSTTSGGTGGASVPTTSDDVTLDANGNVPCTINTTARVCKSLTITSGYTNTLTFNVQLSVSGSITLGANYTDAGNSTNKLRMVAAGTLTTNGRTITRDFEIGASTLFTVTLAENIVMGAGYTLTLSNTTSTTFAGGFSFGCISSTGYHLTISGAQTITSVTFNDVDTFTNSAANVFSGVYVYCKSLTMTGTLSGSSGIYINGGTWSGSSALSVALTFNGNTTVSGSVAANGSITKAAGVITTTGSTLTIGAATTINTPGVTWNNITLTGTSITYTLAADFAWSGTLTISNTTALTFSGSYAMTGGDVSITTAVTVNFNVSTVTLGTVTLGNVAITLAGSVGFTCVTLTTAALSVTRIHTFTYGNTYAITGSWSNVITGANTIRQTIKSSSAGNKVVIKLGYGATQDLLYADPVDVDSNGGQTVVTVKGSISTSYNWTTTVGTKPTAMLERGSKRIGITTTRIKALPQ